MKLTGWPVELSKQWEEMVVSKGWQVGGQHNHGYEDERQENHGGGRWEARQQRGVCGNGGPGKIGWEREQQKKRPTYTSIFVFHSIWT